VCAHPARGRTEREAAAIVSLAKSLNITVIAEGVERPEQFVALADLKCDLLQGYLFSRLIEAEMVPALIKGSVLSGDDMNVGAASRPR
jgi:EAL domain-containing protein (putative c-di-GMP-specific phosphodiesterase class I)